jgi:hypothetical protein
VCSHHTTSILRVRVRAKVRAKVRVRVILTQVGVAQPYTIPVWWCARVDQG